MALAPTPTTSSSTTTPPAAHPGAAFVMNADMRYALNDDRRFCACDHPVRYIAGRLFAAAHMRGARLAIPYRHAPHRRHYPVHHHSPTSTTSSSTTTPPNCNPSPVQPPSQCGFTHDLSGDCQSYCACIEAILCEGSKKVKRADCTAGVECICGGVWPYAPISSCTTIRRHLPRPPQRRLLRPHHPQPRRLLPLLRRLPVAFRTRL